MHEYIDDTLQFVKQHIPVTQECVFADSAPQWQFRLKQINHVGVHICVTLLPSGVMKTKCSIVVLKLMGTQYSTLELAGVVTFSQEKVKRCGEKYI